MAHDGRRGLVTLPSHDGIIPSWRDGQQWILAAAALRRVLATMSAGAGRYAGGADVLADLPAGQVYPAFVALLADGAGEVWAFGSASASDITFAAADIADAALYLVPAMMPDVSPAAALGGWDDYELHALDAAAPPDHGLLLGTGTVAGGAFTAFTGPPRAAWPPALAASDIDNDSGVDGDDVAAALDALAALIDAAEPAGAVAAHVAAADPHTQYQKESEKGQANGYAPLGADGLVPAVHLPEASSGITAFDLLGDTGAVTLADGDALNLVGNDNGIDVAVSKAGTDITAALDLLLASDRPGLEQHTDSYSNVRWRVKRAVARAAIPFLIDGGGAVIGTGIKGDIEVPFDCWIESWTLLADQAGGITIDVWRDTLANFPPTNADSLCGGNEPALNAIAAYRDSTLTGWTRALSEGDILRFNVDSCTSITRVTLSLKVIRG